jgi:hypothetical protein
VRIEVHPPASGESERVNVTHRQPLALVGALLPPFHPKDSPVEPSRRSPANESVSLVDFLVGLVAATRDPTSVPRLRCPHNLARPSSSITFLPHRLKGDLTGYGRKNKNTNPAQESNASRAKNKKVHRKIQRRKNSESKKAQEGVYHIFGLKITMRHGLEGRPSEFSLR